MNTNKINVEYLSKDILQKEFIRNLKTIYFFQTLMASTRVYIKDSFVTSPTALQKWHTVFNILEIIALNIFVVHKYIFSISGDKNVYYLSLCATGLQSMTFFCNVIHVRFFNGDANAEFFITLQKIDRCMKLAGNKYINSILYKLNIFTVAYVLLILNTLLATAATKGTITFITVVGITYAQSCFLLELGCCSNYLIHYFVRVRFINAIMKNHVKQKKIHGISPSWIQIIPTKRFMRQLAAESHNFIWSETDRYLKAIFNGFSNLQNIYKFQVFIFFCKLVFSCLITFEFLLYGVQNESLNLLESLAPAIFTAIDLLMAIMLVVRSEMFLREVEETKHLAIAVLSQHHEGRLREKAKRMLKYIEETPPRFSVYDMWQLNANALLNMFALVTGLVLTQLQFTFL